MQLRTLLLALAIVAIAVATTYYIVTVDTDTPFATTEPAAGASEPTARLIAPGDGAPSTPIARDDAQSPLPDAWK